MRARNAAATTYNLEVDDFDTYFVGQTGVWVHNGGPAMCPATSTKALNLKEASQLLGRTVTGWDQVTVGELRRYGPVRWDYLSVVPGMTGLWQVSGRNATSYERRVELDRLYVERRSAWLDLKILARTCLVVVTRDGAC